MSTVGWPQQGQYVDLKQRDISWQVGYVLFRNEHTLKLRFEGWQQKYDEIVHLHDDFSFVRNSKIQPFRSMTRGYSGPQKHPGTRQHWKFTLEEHQNRLKKVEDFIVDLRQKTPEQLVQFIRGEHYFYINFLMAQTYLLHEDISEVYTYFEKHIILAKDYFQFITSKGISWLQPNSNAMSEDLNKWERTYIDCYYEIIESLFLISGLSERLSSFLKVNEKLIKNIVGICETHHNYVAEKFAQLGLVASARTLIKATQTIVTSQKPPKLPFPFVYSLIQLFMTTQRSYLLQKDMEVLKQLKDELFIIVSARFEELEPEDLKNDIQIDREIQFVLSHMKGIFLMSTKRPLTNEWMDCIKIKINILLIRCDKLERRLKGIQKLKEYCEISMREEDDWNEARLQWHKILSKFKCFELLFLENEHPEIFRRAIEFGHTLSKYNIIGIEEIRYIWNNSIKKLPIFVKLLHQFWQQISYFIALADIPAFIQIVETSSQEPNQTNEEIEFFFQFMHVLGKNLKDLKSRQEKNLEVYEKSLSDLIRRSIVKIREYQTRENIQMLIECLSKSIVNYSNCLQISFQLYEQLRSKESYRMSLNILQQIYFHSDNIIYFPPDYFQILFQCLKMEGVTNKDVMLIIKMINDIMLMNGKQKNEGGAVFKYQNMKLLWQHFNHCSDELRGIFYDWILSTKRYDGLDPYHYINLAFSNELKKFIFHHIILSKEFINLKNISKRETEIIVQFIMFININKQKIEKKNYYNNYKVVYRLKQVDLIGEELLWQLFQKCHTNELTNYINRYLIIFHFHYTSLIPFELRKQRIARFMQKIIANIKEAEVKSFNIFKPSLNLLRRVLDLIREDRKHEFVELNTSRVKLQISYNNILYNLEVNIEEKISSIRAKIKNLLRLKDNHFKLYVAKAEELSFDHYDLSLCFLTDRIFKVVEVPPEEETIPKIVTSYFDQQFERILLKMLQNKNIFQDVFNFVNDMELKLNKHLILEIFKLSLDKCFVESQKLNKQALCYFMLQIKIYNKLLDENVDLTTYLQDDQFKKLLSIMGNPIETQYHITNLTKLCYLIHKIYKKEQVIPPAVCLPEKCMQTMNQICKLVIKSQQSLVKQLPYHDLIVKIFQNCNNFIEYNIGENKMLQFYTSQTCFQSIFESLYTHYQLGEVRTYMSERLKNYLTTLGQLPSQSNTQIVLARLFFDEVFIKLIMNFDNEDKAKNFKGILEFYILMALFISKMNSELYHEFVERIKYKEKSFFQIVLQYLNSVKKKEGHESYWQNYLYGNFIILTSVINRSPQFISDRIVDFLLVDCLALTSIIVDRPLCRKPAAISSCFELLEQILKNNTSFEISKHVVCSLMNSHKITIWRNPSDWSITMRNQGKQKYRGLINLGCICYMNSLLQQLYMIDEFRLTIVGMPSEPVQQKIQNDESQGKQDSQNSHNEFSIVHALKELFLSLQFSEQNVINPLNFARTIRSNDKRPMIKINEQMDIDEFESILFDRLEHGISSIGRDNFIKGLFGGVYAHQIISKECPHTSEREEEFISISLEVKRHIQDCFKSLVKIQTLEGENKYFCEKCDRKVKAQKMQTIKKLPPYLILCLKRFEFNFEIDAKIKINEYCQFTHQLNLKQYSQQQVIKKSKEVLIEQAQTEQQKIPDSYFDYKLRGVVVHSGSADSGHYYSFIETKQGEWYQFNDEEVTPFNLSKLPQQAFGSKDNYQQIKNRNAYLLIYQRASQSHNDLKVKQKEIMSMPENNRIINLIRKKNRDIHKYELLFSKEYEILVSRIMHDACRVNIESEIIWYQFLVSYFLLIRIRKDNMPELVQYSKKLEKKLETNPSFCKIFMYVFLSTYLLEEFFIFNPFRQKSKIIASLFFTSLKHYYISIKHLNNYKFDKIIQYILYNLKLFFIVNTPIAELTIYFRKFIQYLLIQQRDFEFLRHIETICFFEKLMMDFIFPFQISKKYKEENMVKYNNYRSSNKYKIDYISNVSIEGKPVYPIAIGQCWKLIATLMKVPYPTGTTKNESLTPSDSKDDENSSLQISKIRKQFFQSMKRQIDSLPSSKISNHVNDTNNFRGIHSMYVVFKELGLTHKLLDSIEHGLKDLESSKYRGFLMLIDIIANDPETSETDIEKIINGLQKNHKHNDRYFLEIDLMHQWIVKYATQSELFLEVLQQKRQFIETMIEWINKLPAPTPEIIKKHKNPQAERLLHRYFGITVSSEPKDYEVSSARIKKQLQCILKMKLKTTSWNPPLSEDFSVGQTIEYFDMVFTEWKRAKVLQNNFGQILLQREKSEVKFYLWDDSERVRKAKDRIDLQIISEKNSDISYGESHEGEKPKSNTDK